MTTIVQWLENAIEGAKEAIELANGIGGDWQEAECEKHRLTVLKEQLEQERQKHELDWQAECEAWRRGIEGFVEWILPLVLEIPGERDMADTDFKRALDSRLVYALIYRKLIALCPQAIINWNAPPLTPGEIAEINQIMRDEGLIE